MPNRRPKGLKEKEEIIFFLLQNRYIWSPVYWLSINLVPDNFMNVNIKHVTNQTFTCQNNTREMNFNSFERPIMMSTYMYIDEISVPYFFPIFVI